MQTRIYPLGYLEHVSTAGVTGWASDQAGRPTHVAIRVNGKFVTAVIGNTYRPDLITPGRLATGTWGFYVPLKLAVGDSVEAVHLASGMTLGVQTVQSPVQKPKIGIVAAAKQEAPYLLEWIAYHRALGIHSFFIADNGGTDSTTHLLSALDHAGYVTRLDWIGHKAFQMRYYGSIVPRLCGSVDLVALIDVDEFIHPMQGHTDIPSAMAELFSGPGVSAVAMNWAIYGSSNRLDPGDGLVIERFTYRALENFPPNLHVKTVVRPEYFAAPGSWPHFVYISGGTYIDSEKKNIRWHPTIVGISQHVAWGRLRVNHFVVKSRLEFEMKRKRGCADGAADRDLNFFPNMTETMCSIPCHLIL
jgi:Glycosyl transferase family 2